jgi:hypothetical protein
MPADWRRASWRRPAASGSPARLRDGVWRAPDRDRPVASAGRTNRPGTERRRGFALSAPYRRAARARTPAAPRPPVLGPSRCRRAAHCWSSGRAAIRRFRGRPWRGVRLWRGKPCRRRARRGGRSSNRGRTPLTRISSARRRWRGKSASSADSRTYWWRASPLRSADARWSSHSRAGPCRRGSRRG